MHAAQKIICGMFTLSAKMGLCLAAFLIVKFTLHKFQLSGEYLKEMEVFTGSRMNTYFKQSKAVLVYDVSKSPTPLISEIIQLKNKRTVK